MSKRTYIEESAPESVDFDAGLRASAQKLLELMEICGDAGDASKLSQAFAAIESRMHQRDKARRKALDTYTRDELIDHLKNRGQEGEEIARSVLGVDDSEPLL